MRNGKLESGTWRALRFWNNMEGAGIDGLPNVTVFLLTNTDTAYNFFEGNGWCMADKINHFFGSQENDFVL